MERQEFEDSWKEAFKDSEVIPSDNVWTNVELDLERAKAATLRKRLVRYQLLAAASILFSIGVGVSVFISNKNADSSLIALKESSTAVQSEKNLAEVEKSTSAEDRKSTTTSNNNLTDVQASTSPNVSKSSERKIITNQKAAEEVEESNASVNEILSAAQKPSEAIMNDSDLLSAVVSRSASLVEVYRPSLAGNIFEKKNEVDPVVSMMAKLEQREKEILEEESSNEKHAKVITEKVWSSVGVAAGSFKSVNSGASPSLANSSTSALASSIANQETKASGVAYSMGVNLGTKVTERWMVQGGVNYLNQTSEYTQQSLVQTQNFTSFRPASINELNQLAAGDATDQKTAITSAPYDVNNNVRYLSIPVQAGYLIVNRGIGLQMNAGVSTDLFLQNTVSATSDGEKVDPVKAGIGRTSAFRPLNFSGLMGTEVSYKFAKHYRVALNPGVRYPFSSIYRSDFYKSSRLTFDVGLRFRYIFH
jgi:hypothetical protein